MSEMLANQYFLTGHYERALPLLERFLSNSSDRAYLKNKLLICYLQTGQIDRGLEFCLEIQLLLKSIKTMSNSYTSDWWRLTQQLISVGNLPTATLIGSKARPLQ